MFAINQDLLPWIQEILKHCTPATRDKALLDNLSKRQIVDSTYLENVLPKVASDVNFLVPRSLYECKTNQVWRYPPHIYCDFLIKGTEETVVKLRIKFAIPRFIRYGERQYGETEKRKQVTRHAKTTPSINLPEGFGDVALFDRVYNMHLEGSMRATSVKPKLFEDTVEFKIGEVLKAQGGEEITDLLSLQEEAIVVKKYDANANEVQSSGQDEPPTDLGYEPIKTGTQKENIKIGYVELVYGPAKASILASVKNVSPGLYRIALRLTNDENYNKNPPRTAEWMRRSLILPHLFILVENGEPNLPIQQHYESLQLAVEKGEHKLANEYDEKTYVQTNSVLTKSVVEKDVLCLSTFGVYDTIKEIPENGPSVNELLNDDASFLKQLYLLRDEEKQKLRSNPSYLPTIKAVIRAAVKSFSVTEYLYKFQWDAIQNRLRIILNGEEGTTTIVKAPTATGKTLVFMVNAALHSLLRNQRSVLIFPTRILNEDMFRRLTKFVHEMRAQMPDVNVTGGIYIGQSDPLYKALSNPTAGKVMIQFDTCPACGKVGSIVAKEQGIRKIGQCSDKKCGHEISYMFNPREVTEYLPLITIATPDNLFYYSTNHGSEQFNMRFFGGYFAKCVCGLCNPAMSTRVSSVTCKCGRTVDLTKKETSPIGYFVFDEVHSLYGLTGILLSIYMKAVEIVANKIRDPGYFTKPLQWQSTFETGTATIANELDLLQSITRVPREKIYIVPKTQEYFQYFKPKPDLVKYRTVLTLPIARAARTSVSNALLRSYYAIHIDQQFSSAVNQTAAGAYDFILGYVFRKSDGYTLRRTIRDLANQELGQNLNAEFLSGDATTSTIANLFQMAVNKKIRMLIANLVISLGIDIANMNNIIMMGLPKSMTEFVQTAGRTGRGKLPGHTVVHLLPSNPRDMYAYENFHRVFCDVGGYFEMKPIQSTNAYASKIIFPNILKFMMSAQSYHQWILSVPQANRYFSNPTAQRAIMLDVLKALTDPSTPDSVRKIIGDEAQIEFKEFLMKWIKISGPNNWMAEWFKKDGHLLNTLRENTDKDIVVQVDNIELFKRVSEQFRPPWADSPEEEALDNDESGDED